MDARAVLKESFARLDEHVGQVCEGLDPAWLTEVVVPGTNHIGWLLWHGARQHDAQVAHGFGTRQVWEDGDWAARFGTDPSPDNHGYGHTAEQVAAVRPDSVEVVVAYQEAVGARTAGLLGTVDGAALDRVIDDRWDPPVTLGVRLVSVSDDAAQHFGQAKYLRGQLERRHQAG